MTLQTPASRRRLLGAVAMAAVLTAMVQGSQAHAQTLNDRFAQRGANSKSRLAVEAREIVYDRDNDRVEARGDVQLYYDNRVMEADRVTYDRKTRRVYAEGNVRLKEVNGQIIYTDRLELTDDFRDGFIDSLRVVSPDNQRISAARGERTDGETTVFEKGTYTSCLPCKDNPEKPPLWQVKAARIIHKNSEQMLYYEDARLEFFGLPIGYIPFASAPDPTVSRKSGLLTPRYLRRATTGYGVQIPLYFAPAPHYDVLWTITPMTRQGVLNEVEWRHRLETGVYNIRAAGIWQADPGAFLPGPFGPNKPRFGPLSTATSPIPSLTAYPVDLRRFRGSAETTGKFLINDKWTFGWDIALQTDRFFFNNYRVKSESITSNYFRESISNVYLGGKTDRAYFDLQGIYIQSLSSFDLQKQLPVIHPVLDYNRRFQLEGPIGGELSLDVNATSLSRHAADYVGLPSLAQRFAVGNKTPWGIGNTRFIANGQSLFAYRFGDNRSGGIGIGCDPLIGGYAPPTCLLRGIAGTTSRASAVVSWRRSFIDPIGQVWTPFVSAQVDARTHSIHFNGGFAGDPFGIASRAFYDPGNLNPSLFQNGVYGNDKQRNFLANDSTSFNVMPSIGVEYRYPLIANSSFGSHLFEPIAQIVARPNEARIGRRPNEDAQSLIFSDANLFSLNKFSGYDRIEGGVRANVGAQYTLNLNNGGYANALFGRSYHLAGRNSFAVRDQINTGIDSGLDKARSDFVGRVTFAPVAGTTFSARGRFDEASLKLKRLELSGSFVAGPVSGSIVYARQDAQPDLGFVRRREGVALSGRVGLPNNWFVTGGVLIDLDRYLFDRDLTINSQITYAQQVALSVPNPTPPITKFNSSPFRPASFNLGFGYIDECTTFTVNYMRSTSDYVGATRSTNSTVLFRLELKHLGQVGFRQTLSGTPPSETLR